MAITTISSKPPEPQDLLPHAPPMVLIDAVVDYGTDYILCTALSHLQPQNPLRIEGALSIFTGIEYAAQAMAAHNRLLMNDNEQTSPRKGVIAVASKLVAQQPYLDTEQSALSIKVDVLAQTADSSLAQFTIHSNNKELLRGQLTAALQPA